MQIIPICFFDLSQLLIRSFYLAFKDWIFQTVNILIEYYPHFHFLYEYWHLLLKNTQIFTAIKFSQFYIHLNKCIINFQKLKKVIIVVVLLFGFVHLCRRCTLTHFKFVTNQKNSTSKPSEVLYFLAYLVH